MLEHADVHWRHHDVSRAERERLNGHCGCVVWFTGLSGSGKSTIANLADRKLYERGVHSFVLDGDNLRHGLCASPALLGEHGQAFAQRFGLGFSAQDREENIRRVGAVAELFAAAGLVVLTAFVSPYRRDRDRVRRRIAASLRPDDFIEVYVRAPLEVCEARDPKGLYRKARAGELQGMTGVDDPYEPPVRPELTLDSARGEPDALAEQVVRHLERAGKLRAD